MRFLKSQRGFSLIEVIVGMVLLSILVGAVLSVTMGDKKSFSNKVTGNASCRAEAHRIMGNFKNKGLMRSYYHLPSSPAALPAPNTHVFTAGAGSVETGLTPAERWVVSGTADTITAPVTIMDPATSVNILRPYTLIMGVMTTLETIYNNNPAVCGAAGMAGASSPAPLNEIFATPIGMEDSGETNSGLREPEAHLHINLFDTTTGTLITGPPHPCTADAVHNHVALRSNTATNSFQQRPPGLSTFNHPNSALPAAALMRVGQEPSGLFFNAGYEVTIRVSYTNRSDELEECSVSERFQYPHQLVNPSRPLRLDDLDTMAPPAAALNFQNMNDANVPENLNTTVQSTGRAGGIIDYTDAGPSRPMRSCDDTSFNTINIRVANARPGSIFMCRNLTRQRPRSIPTISQISPAGGFPGTYEMIIVDGVRQTFFSTELMQNTTSFNNTGGTAVPATANGVTGDMMFFNGLFYPQGTYYCNPADNCDNLPRFDNGTYFNNALTGFYGLSHPSEHNSNTVTLWDATYGTGQWQPCEYTQIRCAVDTYSATGVEQFYSPVIAQFVPGGTNGAGVAIADAYHLKYGNNTAAGQLPTGCAVHMQIAEVDSAYNIRAIEVHEYMQEKVPGDRLVYNRPAPHPSHIASRPDGWSFYCHAAGASPLLGAVPACPITTARNPGTATSARYDISSTCFINYPGIAAGNGGVWHTDPGASEAFDEP